MHDAYLTSKLASSFALQVEPTKALTEFFYQLNTMTGPPQPTTDSVALFSQASHGRLRCQSLRGGTVTALEGFAGFALHSLAGWRAGSLTGFALPQASQPSVHVTPPATDWIH